MSTCRVCVCVCVCNTCAHARIYVWGAQPHFHASAVQHMSRNTDTLAVSFAQSKTLPNSDFNIALRTARAAIFSPPKLGRLWPGAAVPVAGAPWTPCTHPAQSVICLKSTLLGRGQHPSFFTAAVFFVPRTITPQTHTDRGNDPWRPHTI